jgi:protein-disulfide isomerase
VVAEIGGKPITWNELYEVAASDLVAAEAALYEARAQALDGMIVQRVVEAEALKRGTTPEEMVRAEVESAAKPVTDADVSAFYEKNKGQMDGTLDQMKPQIQQYLEQQRSTDAIRALISRLESEAGVKKFLPSFRVAVSPGDSPRHGSPDAPIQIVEFSDFQCPYCSQAAETVREVEKRYGDKVSVVYRHFPLPMHAQAHRAAEASQCANDQGGFWAFHDALFADQKAWTDDDLKGYAKSTGLDVKRFNKCLESGQHVATVDDDMAAGHRAGMGGTPGFYINGIVVSGSRPVEEFAEIIDRELAAGG